MTLGQSIKKYRKNAKLSQEKVAEIIGVSRQAVTKWEADQTAPNTENLFKLAEIFGTTVDQMVHSEKESDSNTAEEIFHLYKMDQEKKAILRSGKYKRNLKMTVLIISGYLLIYLIGRIICGDFANSSFIGWLTGTDSKYYLFGWLSHQGWFWISMVISAIPAVFGQYRFSCITLTAFVFGLLVGELLGPNPAGAAYGHTHYGWAIWGVIFVISIVVGIIIERKTAKKEGEKQHEL